MTDSFRETHYPLGIHCGHSFWHRLQLTNQFRQQPPPAKTYLRQLIADELRQLEASSLTAAELELLATLNQVLLQIGRHYLQSRNCRISRNQLQADSAECALPQLETTLLQFLQLFPALPIEFGNYQPAELIAAAEADGQLNELVLEKA